MDIAYGIEVLEEGDPYLQVAGIAFAQLADIVIPGKYLVNSLPICESIIFRSKWFLISCKVRYVPSWFPGAGFKNKAKECAKMSEATRRLPWEAVMKSTVSTYPSPRLNCNIISTDHVLGGRHRKAVVLHILSCCTRSSWR